MRAHPEQRRAWKSAAQTQAAGFFTESRWQFPYRFSAQQARVHRLSSGRWFGYSTCGRSQQPEVGQPQEEELR